MRSYQKQVGDGAEFLTDIMYDSESDNEAPEDVTFQQAREASKSLERDQMSGDKIQKLRKREMNKARAAALKEQKVGSGNVS